MNEYYGPDHVQVFWKHKCFGNKGQLETRPLIADLIKNYTFNSKIIYNFFVGFLPIPILL